MGTNDNLHEKHRERMRKKYLDSRLSGFDDHQVLELLLYYSVPRRDTNELAHKLINEYGGLGNLFDADPVNVMKRCKVSEGTAVLVTMIPHLARRYFRVQLDDKESLDSTKKIGKLAISLLAGRPKECFYCICLDIKRRLIASTLIKEGSLTQADVYPREVAECAIKYRATGIVLAHNHPSSDLLPSNSDIHTTSVIKHAMELLDIEVVDHIIVGGDKYFSFVENRKL